MDSLSPQNNEPNDKFATIEDVPIQSQSDRTNPNQIPTGVSRGTQRFIGPDGSYMTLGVIPDSTSATPQFGIAFFDSSGTLIAKITGVTQYIYDKTTGKNILQVGKLPDNTYGWAIAKAGFNVSDGIS